MLKNVLCDSVGVSLWTGCFFFLSFLFIFICIFISTTLSLPLSAFMRFSCYLKAFPKGTTVNFSITLFFQISWKCNLCTRLATNQLRCFQPLSSNCIIFLCQSDARCVAVARCCSWQCSLRLRAIPFAIYHAVSLSMETDACPCLPCATHVHVLCRWPCCDLNFDPDRDLAWPLVIVRRGRTTTLYSSSLAPGREPGAG